MLIGVSIFLLFFFWKSVDAQKKKSEHVRLESLKELPDLPEFKEERDEELFE